MDNQWTIVFFSGTGGTRRAALEILKQMEEKKIAADCLELPTASGFFGKKLIILFPVYAFDAPSPLYDWIEKADLKDCETVVISVSGGGEMWPNTGCRNPLIKSIENKGGIVIHETMLIMPVNFLVPGNNHINMRLLNILPRKIESLVQDILEKKYHRSKSRLGLIQKIVSAAEKKGAHAAGRNLRSDERCTGCGFCARNCPTGNIDIVSAGAVFNSSCILCMRCIYSCPEKAIVSKSRFVLKEGFDLDALEKRMEGVELLPPGECARGLLWKEVRNYLKEPESDFAPPASG